MSSVLVLPCRLRTFFHIGHVSAAVPSFTVPSHRSRDIDLFLLLCYNFCVPVHRRISEKFYPNKERCGMKIQPGDYMVWYGSNTKTGHCRFWRRSSSGFSLEPVRFPNGDDKFYAEFVHTADDFWYLGVIIAETHDMFVEPVGPDKEADYPAFRNHDAVRFVPRP